MSWKNVAGLVLFVLVIFVLMCRAEKAYVDPLTIRSFKFTKACRSIDATHDRCDGVIFEHAPKIVLKKPEAQKLLCKPGD